MAGALPDIETSFSYLHENIPAWYTQVAEIENKVVRLQEELAKVPLARSVPLKRKTNSIESLRGIDVDAQDASAFSPVQINPAVTRKRKSPSVLSGNASGPSKFRSRNMIVVTYDGEIQKSFEQLVRAIGTGRNLLRKGKMAAKLEAMTALSALHDDNEEEEQQEEKGGGVLGSKMICRQRIGLSAMRDGAAMVRTGVTDQLSTPVQAFESADKALELAQSLCENAAHQILREGDCRKDLKLVRSHIEEVQEMAKREVAKHAALREQREKKEREAPPAIAPAPIKAAGIQIPSPKPSSEPVTPPDHNDLLQMSMVPSDDDLNGPPKTMEIEVDEDEEDEDVNFVMPMPPLRFRTRA